MTLANQLTNMHKFKNKISFILGLSAIVAFTSCNKGFEKNENGLQYKIHTDNKGDRIKKGDVAELHFRMRTAKDSVLGDSYKSGLPQPIPIGEPLFKGSVEEGLVLLTKGDSASFLINADSMFKNQPMPSFIEKGSFLKLDVKVVNVQSEEQFRKTQDEEMMKQQEKAMAELANQKPIDDQLIQDYIKKNNIKATKTGSGLYYVIKKQGKGPKPAAGDNITAKYAGKLLDGTLFDSSESFDFQIGSVIEGWNEGMQLLSKGSIATFIIPSGLAYKNQQAGAAIKPNSVLLFDVELLDVKKPAAN